MYYISILRLPTTEKQLEIPGSFLPSFWFTYLFTKKSTLDLNKREEVSSKHADIFFFSFSNISQEKLEP